MTLPTTHIAVESIIVWVLMGKKNRQIFKKRLWLFTLLTLFAYLPDLDTLFYIHRTYFHSIVWPLFIILGVFGWLSFEKLIRKKVIGEKADLIWRSIIIVCIFLILHSFLDLNPGPVLLFYPFDTRLYKWNVSMVWDLDTFYFLKELKFEWISLSFNEGLDNSIFNLTPQQKIDYFGAQFIELFIGEFPIHFFSLLTWTILFPVTSVVLLLRKRPKPDSFFKKLLKFRNPMIVGGIILLTFGLTLGPGFRLNRTENREYSQRFSYSQNEVFYGTYRNFELDKKDALDMNGLFAGNNSACEIVAVIANETQFTTADESLTEIFELYNESTSYNYTWLVSSYRNITDDFIDNSLIHYSLTQNYTTGINYTLPSRMTLYAVTMLVDWNESIAFEVETKIFNTLHIKRVVEFSFGMIFTAIGLIVAAIPIIDTIAKTREGESDLPEQISKNEAKQETDE
ncbi:MAG: metal-dependent hydrolase [Asgard group archaeon]|nr:metal-dependent hydrolase [Asgard group archaeon]